MDDPIVNAYIRHDKQLDVSCIFEICDDSYYIYL